MPNEVILIIGASSGIANALIKNFLSNDSVRKVFAVSRSLPKTHFSGNTEKIEWLLSNYTESSVEQIVAGLMKREVNLNKVIICNGVLHDATISPEKRVEDIKLLNLEAVMRINAFLPMLWIKNLKTLLRKSGNCSITAFTARIGSIQDNAKGGWYAYRASKAALNMLMKTASIEYRREFARISFLLFHPGTTDTALSQPFQKRIASTSILEPDFVAEKLITILNSVTYDADIKFLDWKGQQIAW